MEELVPTIRELYPHLTDEQLAEAEDNIERYLALILRIYERIRADPEAYTEFRRLTGAGDAVTCIPSEAESTP